MGGGSEKDRPGRVTKVAVGEGEGEGERGGRAPIMMGTPGRGVEQTGAGERGEHDDEVTGELGPLTIIIWFAGDMGCTTGGDMGPREAPIAPPFSSFQ
jgi:hypothetical protein